MTEQIGELRVLEFGFIFLFFFRRNLMDLG